MEGSSFKVRKKAFGCGDFQHPPRPRINLSADRAAATLEICFLRQSLSDQRPNSFSVAPPHQHSAFSTSRRSYSNYCRYLFAVIIETDFKKQNGGATETSGRSP